MGAGGAIGKVATMLARGAHPQANRPQRPASTLGTVAIATRVCNACRSCTSRVLRNKSSHPRCWWDSAQGPQLRGRCSYRCSSHAYAWYDAASTVVSAEHLAAQIGHNLHLQLHLRHVANICTARGGGCGVGMRSLLRSLFARPPRRVVPRPTSGCSRTYVSQTEALLAYTAFLKRRQPPFFGAFPRTSLACFTSKCVRPFHCGEAAPGQRLPPHRFASPKRRSHSVHFTFVKAHAACMHRACTHPHTDGP